VRVGLEAGIKTGGGDGGGGIVAFTGIKDGGGMSVVTRRDEAGIGVAAISRMMGMGPKLVRLGFGVVKEVEDGALLDLVGVAGRGRTSVWDPMLGVRSGVYRG
jgi:hypothetical protein